MRDEVLVRAENVSKRFCRSLKRSLWYGLQDLGSELIGGRHRGATGLDETSRGIDLRQDEFWAVQDVSFELRRGECLGLIGRNGAGKTTLLRMLNGLIKPDTGRIEMRGRVGAVIALGAGFNPVLSGRENIYVNASVMGLPQDEINSRFDEIVAFAELDEFIDMPVQSYSSGMQVRLGFAVATALKPDVLILDEVLAVGDARFRSKCYKKIDELVNDAAVIFVSHNMDQIARLCSKALCLKRGVGHETKDLSAAVLGYENDGTLDLSESRSFVSANQAVENFSFRVNSKSHSPGASLDLEISCRTEISLNDLKLRIVLYNSYGLMCADSGFVPALSLEPHHLGGETVFLVSVPWIPLKPGSYTISVNMTGSKGQLALWAHKVSEFMVSGVFSGAFTDCLLSLEPAPSSGDAPGIRKDEPFTDCRKPLLSRGAAG